MAPPLTAPDQAAGWILRRVGFGATTNDFDHVAEIGVDAFLDELFEPDTFGVADDGDPWGDEELARRVERPLDRVEAILPWFRRMVAPSRPLTEWLAWFWHGHLVSSLASVPSPRAMAGQIRLLRESGQGSFRPLLRAVTIDPAMLRYLDGDRSTGGSPNENYSRELLELFALGVGNYDEADVVAGAAALTGWTRRRGTWESIFVTRRHDDTHRTFLGVDGVHDLDTVIDAVVAHPACAHFVVRSLAAAVLGPDVAEDVALAEAPAFAADDLHVLPLVRRLIERGLDGQYDPLVITPVPWLAWALRVAEADVGVRSLADVLRSAGQVPLMPPNVSGWPSGDAWLSASATTARLDAARLVSEAAGPASAPVLAAESGDLDSVARSLGRPGGFSPSTRIALDRSGATGRSLLALALSTPDLVIT